jgi:predicted dehydrogenase
VDVQSQATGAPLRKGTPKKIKIIGAGSIGTHHAHACRQLGWDVTVVDVSSEPLDRMRTQLFPSRYGAWDASIQLHTSSAAPRGDFDLIIIGTPPDSHLPLAADALEENPAALLIEKPLAPPFAQVDDLVRQSRGHAATRIFVGYDHVVGLASQRIAQELGSGSIGAVLTIDVEFREHWAGIFQAHPWLAGPHDSYLGYWKRGGGALGEHSHAANLWQYFAHTAGAGPVASVHAALDYVSEGPALYDRLCVLTLRTERGLLGRVVQDVVTRPARKWARIQGESGAIEWQVGYQPGADAVILKRPGAEDDVQLFPKTRPDDFIQELRHLERCCADGTESPLDLSRAVETLQLMGAAHESQRLDRTVHIGGKSALPHAEIITR